MVFLNLIKFCYYLQFLFLLPSVYSLTLNIDGDLELEANKHNKYIISKLSFAGDEKKKPCDKENRAQIDSIDESDAVVMRAVEYFSTTTHKPDIQDTKDPKFHLFRRAIESFSTMFTTKYEKGTTFGSKSNPIFRSKMEKSKKKKNKRKPPSPSKIREESEPIEESKAKEESELKEESEVKEDSEEKETKKVKKEKNKHNKKKKYERVGPKHEYVYIYFKNDTEGHKQKIIMYNKTHYAYYKNELPSKFYNVYNLWSGLHEPAKIFDEEFKPPWWMEFHKPPYWMQFHQKEKKEIDKDTWDIFHEFHSTSPTTEDAEEEPTTEAAPLPFEPELELQEEPNLESLVSNSQSKITEWISGLWEKLKANHIQEKDGKKIINLSIALPWYRQQAQMKFARKQGNLLEDSNYYMATQRPVQEHTTKFQDITQNTKNNKLDEETMQLLYKEIMKKVEEHIPKTNVDPKLFESIISSNNMVLNLLKIMVGEINKRAKDNSDQIIESIGTKQENRPHMNWQIDHVCEKLGVCKTSSEFIEYVIDILNFVISLKEDKFKIVYNTFLEVVKKLSYRDILKDNDIASLQNAIKLLQKDTVLMQRTRVIILKNIIWTNRVVEGLLNIKKNVSGRVRKAFTRILNKLEEKVVVSDDDRKQWYTIKDNLHSWAIGASNSKHIGRTVQDFVTNFVTILKKLDKHSKQVLLSNFKIILE